MLYKVIPNAKFKMISHYKLTCIFAVTRLAHMFDEDPVVSKQDSIFHRKMSLISHLFLVEIEEQCKPHFLVNHSRIYLLHFCKNFKFYSREIQPQDGTV